MAVGDVLGGMVAQRNIRAQQELEDRKFALSERQFGLQERQFGQQERAFEAGEATTAQEAFREATRVVTEAVTGIIEQQPNAAGSPLLQGFIEQRRNAIDSQRELGKLPAAFLDQMEQELDLALGATTPTQAGTATGRTAAAELQAKLGRAPTEEERARSAGVAPPTVAPTQIRKLLDDKAAVDQQLSAARQSGDIATATQLEAESVALNGAIKQIQLANVAPDLVTTTTRSRAEEAVTTASSALEAVGGLANLLERTPGQFGFQGALKGLVNKTLAQAIPDLFSKDRQIAESAVEATRSNLQRAVTDDSRFSDADRDFIFRLFPSTGPFETQEAAEIKVKTLALLFARRLTAASETPGVEIPVELSNFTLRDLIGSVQDGIITEAEGADIAKTLFEDEVRALSGNR